MSPDKIRVVAEMNAQARREQGSMEPAITAAIAESLAHEAQGLSDEYRKRLRSMWRPRD